MEAQQNAQNQDEQPPLLTYTPVTLPSQMLSLGIQRAPIPPAKWREYRLGTPKPANSMTDSMEDSPTRPYPSTSTTPNPINQPMNPLQFALTYPSIPGHERPKRRALSPIPPSDDDETPTHPSQRPYRPILFDSSQSPLDRPELQEVSLFDPNFSYLSTQNSTSNSTTQLNNIAPPSRSASSDTAYSRLNPLPQSRHNVQPHLDTRSSPYHSTTNATMYSQVSNHRNNRMGMDDSSSEQLQQSPPQEQIASHIMYQQYSFQL